jgi:ferric-dicitrate binding protein FerR (iron transport regulator)
MDLEKYTVNDFVMNEHFREWVLTGNDQFWDDWLQTHPQKSAEVEEAKRIILSLHFPEDELSQEQYTRLSDNILEKVMAFEKNKRTPTSSPFRQSKSTYTRVAASILLFFCLGTLLFIWLQYIDKAVVYTTGYGQTRTVALPDGSTVFLNANSSLKHKTSWQSKAGREVWLEGEAFFIVQKKQQETNAIKFIVHTDDVQVEVLGTEFTVSKRRTNTRVILNEGKIRLDIIDQPTRSDIVMKPGDWVEYEALQHRLTRKTVNAHVYSSWTKKKWILENTSLLQVAEQIQETFGLEVSVPDTSLQKESMTGVIPVETLDEALEVLTSTYNIKIEKKNNRLIINRSLP